MVINGAIDVMHYCWKGYWPERAPSVQEIFLMERAGKQITHTAKVMKLNSPIILINTTTKRFI